MFIFSIYVYTTYIFFTVRTYMLNGICFVYVIINQHSFEFRTCCIGLARGCRINFRVRVHNKVIYLGGWFYPQRRRPRRGHAVVPARYLHKSSWSMVRFRHWAYIRCRFSIVTQAVFQLWSCRWEPRCNVSFCYAHRSRGRGNDCNETLSGMTFLKISLRIRRTINDLLITSMDCSCIVFANCDMQPYLVVASFHLVSTVIQSFFFMENWRDQFCFDLFCKP